MKTLTLTLHTTQTPMPTGFSDFAGFKITVTDAAGKVSSPPVSQLTTWNIAGFVEGATYKLSVASVDSAGAVIDNMPTMTLNVPAAATFLKVDSADIAWS